ncbi:hypothetical protein CW711_05255 [Candidatus Bathyarchaeota archaeon]|nr:MAG: hypothetical protein CW711_05255 [Candidatus Bathyarchaeota archaeon]
MSSEEVEGYYEKVRSESSETIASVLPKIILDVSAAILIWLFGKLVFVPIAEGIYFLGYPLPQLLNFILIVALAVIVFRMIFDVRRLIEGLAGFAACETYDVSPEEVEHYRTALRGIFDIIVVSLIYMLFVDFLSRIHVALSGVALLAIVVWAIYKIWRVVQAVSEEIRRYTTAWAKKALSKP